MKSVQDIRDVFYREGSNSYGENVSQIQHAVQVAKLAEKQNASDQQIAACLLHDIGHLVSQDSLINTKLRHKHEVLGAKILENLFELDVTEPIRLHVKAKRYLCSIDDDYYNDLSDASKESLLFQGGRFELSEQMEAFEENLFFREAIQLRQLDDIGKNPDDLNINFDDYLPLLRSLTKKS